MTKKVIALDEILEDAYGGKCNFTFKAKKYREQDIKIFIGKEYKGIIKGESTEVDASIELPDKLIFIEAKLYSSISLADPSKKKPHDQIARKLRVGVDSAGNKEFYFIFLDIAPIGKLIQRKTKTEALSVSKGGFYDKWKSAWWFSYYKDGRNKSLKPLRDILEGITSKSEQSIADNMGWLTWSDLYKNILSWNIKAPNRNESPPSPNLNPSPITSFLHWLASRQPEMFR
ncbi:MAG: hypothetical protein IPN22_06540 [Bacteroidetes bacterium]|nr:hypothetical protein [Bacteroidota bacterium]